MGLFNRIRKAQRSDFHTQIAQRIASGLLSAQRRLADRINSRISQLPLTVQLSLLVAMGAVFGIYCGFLLLRAFF